MNLSTHVLDTTLGEPARGVLVRWQRLDGVEWRSVAESVTDQDGRVADWVTARGAAEPLATGTHRLVFGSGDYFSGRGVETFYPEVVVVFAVTGTGGHHHVPLLLSPFAYSTYRGS